MNSRLLESGFEELSEWEIRHEKIKPVHLNWEETSGWIYAYATDESVKYVGITTNVLRTRLDNYSHFRNDRVGALIKEILKSGTGIGIYGLRRHAIPQADLEKEESALIHSLKAEWNVRK